MKKEREELRSKVIEEVYYIIQARISELVLQDGPDVAAQINEFQNLIDRIKK